MIYSDTMMGEGRGGLLYLLLCILWPWRRSGDMSASKLQMPSRNVQIFTCFLSLFLKQTFSMKRTVIYGMSDKIDYFIHTW